MGKRACGVEADTSLDTLREDAGKNGLTQRAVRNSLLWKTLSELLFLCVPTVFDYVFLMWYLISIIT